MPNPDQMLAEIRAKASEKTNLENDEQFSPGDSGNFDEAYGYGIDDGEIWFARELLEKYGPCEKESE